MALIDTTTRPNVAKSVTTIDTSNTNAMKIGAKSDTKIVRKIAANNTNGAKIDETIGETTGEKIDKIATTVGPAASRTVRRWASCRAEWLLSRLFAAP